MKLPRFSLRMLFVLVALAAVPAAGFTWRQSQLKWVQRRRAFLHQPGVIHWDSNANFRTEFDEWPTTPWHLRMFGGSSPPYLIVLPSQADEARRLFPEMNVQVWDRKVEIAPHRFL